MPGTGYVRRFYPLLRDSPLTELIVGYSFGLILFTMFNGGVFTNYFCAT